ncbi:MAG: hypothetical protein KGR26_15730, partial [Cyanobacteria bacterium REEB65]|nr:hypothetical protein [Cyanobacteria bacterium REEB65]
VGPMVEVIGGLEIGNRQEQRFIARRVDPIEGGETDLMTEAGRWFRDECDGADEESDSFLDAVITGMGWTNTRIDYDDDLDGQGRIDRMDPMELFWDASARKSNLSDARRLFWVKDVPLHEAAGLFPDFSTDELNAGWADSVESDAREPHDAQQAPFYRIDQSQKIDRFTTSVRMVEKQWWELESVYRFIDPVDQIVKVASEEEWTILYARYLAMGMDPICVKQRIKKYYRAILGSKLLKKWSGPAKGGFTWKCITARQDRNKGTFYGVVRAMMDPQRWANKWLSQTMHIMNTGAKGGIIAERDAFEDTQEAEDTWADSSAIVWANKGALSGPGGSKIQPRPPNNMPPALDKLLTFAISSIRDTTGVSLELLG